jgi:predicted nucleic acid-binding protein
MRSARYVAVLDACVLYPAPLRDVLLSLALQGLFQAKWSETINDEWMRNVLSNRPDLNASQISRTCEQMVIAIPDGLVTEYEHYIQSVTLPDDNDRHVVACAIAGRANAIVTFNLRDFPESELKKHQLEAIHPDDFVVHQFHLDQTAFLVALKRMRARLRNPQYTVEQFLDRLERVGLKQTTSILSGVSELL